ncbi:DprA-like DNA recombination-mediator protein [Sinorhizobium phage ort11]|uniref:DNA recombination-mediator protein A n=1 Tax=Sinorhizobium phage ort11 TaxID=2599764 RepID=A0A5C2H6C2_9CAUD|nr:DprA-like DNA recombination-mediator protein [Sinorhizobium phage ort11]QEP29823.1 hypothetical protein Smphiort11_025 [Sinorhizobium phage ort11]
MKAYAGIGSRKTPQPILDMMTNAATWLQDAGWILRSGGAHGADTAFENGTKEKEIYIPWGTFNNRKHGFNGAIDINKLEEKDLAAALQITKQYHPAWENCAHYAQMLHTRNVFQMFGRDFKNPSKFVLCWTKDGKGGGGTGQAIRIAKGNNIPVFDLGRPDIEKVQEDCFNFVNSFKEMVNAN